MTFTMIVGYYITSKYKTKKRDIPSLPPNTFYPFRNLALDNRRILAHNVLKTQLVIIKVLHKALIGTVSRVMIPIFVQFFIK